MHPLRPRTIVLSTIFVGALHALAFAQTPVNGPGAPAPGMIEVCDPYGSHWVFPDQPTDALACRLMIPGGYTGYVPPNGIDRVTFFSRLNIGDPAPPPAAGYVWAYDLDVVGGPWYWRYSALANTYANPPQPITAPPLLQTLEVGKFYRLPYRGMVIKVIGIVSPVTDPTPHWMLEQVTPNGGICGQLGTIPLNNRESIQILTETTDPGPILINGVPCPRSTNPSELMQ